MFFAYFINIVLSKNAFSEAMLPLKRFLLISAMPNFVISSSLAGGLSVLSLRSKSSSNIVSLSLDFMFIKSTMMMPLMFLAESWRTISSEASRFSLRKVSSLSLPVNDLAEFTSITHIASVSVITISAPDSSQTRSESICFSFFDMLISF